MHPWKEHAARHRTSNAIMALWIALCLLFAQGLGYAHAISHGAPKPETTFQGTSVDKVTLVLDHQKASNACAALDAATLGAGLPSASPLALLLTLSPSRVVCALPSPWQQSFVALFSSRAPPVH